MEMSKTDRFNISCDGNLKFDKYGGKLAIVI